MDDTPTGETAPVAPSNNANAGAAPVANATDSAEVERLRKDAEQSKMRANQLQNELDAKRESEEAARAKKLEEDGKYKELLDKERAEKQLLIDEKETAERNAVLSKETSDLLANYNPAVVEIARTAGLSLVDDTDDAKSDLSKKLDDIASKLGGPAKVQPNNPAPSVQQPQAKEELVGAMRNPDLRARDRDAAGLKYIGQMGTIKAMKEQAGYPTE